MAIVRASHWPSQQPRVFKRKARSGSCDSGCMTSFRSIPMKITPATATSSKSTSFASPPSHPPFGLFWSSSRYPLFLQDEDLHNHPVSSCRSLASRIIKIMLLRGDRWPARMDSDVIFNSPPISYHDTGGKMWQFRRRSSLTCTGASMGSIALGANSIIPGRMVIVDCIGFDLGDRFPIAAVAHLNDGTIRNLAVRKSCFYEVTTLRSQRHLQTEKAMDKEVYDSPMKILPPRPLPANRQVLPIHHLPFGLFWSSSRYPLFLQDQDMHNHPR